MAEGMLERVVTRLLRVPARPEPPAGSRGSLKVFNAARGFYHYRLAGWVLRQVATGLALIAGLTLLTRIELGPIVLASGLIRLFEMLGVAAYLGQLLPSFLFVGLDYRYRWYMVTDTTLRIREGLMTVREQTMTFANIQNLSVQQGPLQRLFGIADLRVRTAGGGEREGGANESGETTNMHLGYFRGVSNAGEIRDLIIARMRRLRDTGLGDPDEAVPTAAATSMTSESLAAITEAAFDLRAEARRLRRTVQTGSITP
jgi:membrane protein YdbS with pleckstrin-like domain